MPRWRRKTSFKKIDCHIHATRKQRLGADHKFRFQHNIKTLCRVPRVNRSTYYKHFSAELSPCIKENQHIASLIPHVHADYSKRLGACKITYVLKRDYGIDISVGRVYRFAACGYLWYFFSNLLWLVSKKMTGTSWNFPNWFSA